MLARHVIPALLLALAFYTCKRSGTELLASEKAAYKLVNDPPLASVPPKILDIIMLGHGALYDDFITIWAIQILADPQLKNLSSAENLYDSLNSILKFQPRIEGLYLLSCFVFALDLRHPEYCEKISLEGLKVFPESWRIPMTQGFISAFEMKDDLKAAAYYQMAASRPNSPEYVGKLAARLTARGYADGQDLNESVQMLMQAPGGSRIVDILRERFKNTTPPPRPGEQP